MSLRSFSCHGAGASSFPGSRRLLLATAGAGFFFWSSRGPAFCSDSSCLLTRVQGPGYEYVYPSSWLTEKARGIEVLAHDPDEEELNMSITSLPSQRVRLSSEQQLGEVLLSRYKAIPSVKKVELLRTEASSCDDGSRRYTLELRVLLGSKQQRYAFSILKSESKVYSLVLQVPEALWERERACIEAVLGGLRTRNPIVRKIS